MIKQCPICGKKFYPQHKCSKYCSDTCAHQAKTLKKKEKRKAEQLNRKPIPCSFCAKPFVPVNLHMKYCSDECRHLAAKFNDKQYYLRTIDKRKSLRRKRYLAHKDEILAKQRAKRREVAAKQGRTVRPRKPNLAPQFDWRIQFPNLLNNLQNSKPVVVPEAVAQNRLPTTEELLNAIFKEK